MLPGRIADACKRGLRRDKRQGLPERTARQSVAHGIRNRDRKPDGERKNGGTVNRTDRAEALRESRNDGPGESGR